MADDIDDNSGMGVKGFAGGLAAGGAAAAAGAYTYGATQLGEKSIDSIKKKRDGDPESKDEAAKKGLKAQLNEAQAKAEKDFEEKFKGPDESDKAKYPDTDKGKADLAAAKKEHEAFKASLPKQDDPKYAVKVDGKETGEKDAKLYTDEFNAAKEAHIAKATKPLESELTNLARLEAGASKYKGAKLLEKPAIALMAMSPKALVGLGAITTVAALGAAAMLSNNRQNAAETATDGQTR